jgi:hypothetical protein
MSLFNPDEMQNLLDLVLSAPTKTLRAAFDFRPVVDRFHMAGRAVSAGGVIQVLSAREWDDVQASRKAKESAAATAQKPAAIDLAPPSVDAPAPAPVDSPNPGGLTHGSEQDS